jgi:putative transposase
VASWAAEDQRLSIRVACEAFGLSESGSRFHGKRNAENERIADWLLRLTESQRNRSFGLCFLYLRNVRDCAWNHKHVYRIYRALELNRRIKPKRRMDRVKPEPLSVPEAINEVWWTDFMHDQLNDGRTFRVFDVIDDCNREAREAFHRHRRATDVAAQALELRALPGLAVRAGMQRCSAA